MRSTRVPSTGTSDGRRVVQQVRGSHHIDQRVVSRQQETRPLEIPPWPPTPQNSSEQTEDDPGPDHDGGPRTVAKQRSSSMSISASPKSLTITPPRAESADDLSVIIWKLAVSDDCDCSYLQGSARWSRRCLSAPLLRRLHDVITWRNIDWTLPKSSEVDMQTG